MRLQSNLHVLSNESPCFVFQNEAGLISFYWSITEIFARNGLIVQTFMYISAVCVSFNRIIVSLNFIISLGVAEGFIQLNFTQLLSVLLPNCVAWTQNRTAVPLLHSQYFFSDTLLTFFPWNLVLELCIKCTISDFCRGVNEICALKGFYAA